MSRISDEELFGPEVCAALDAFADEAPELTDVQAAVLGALFRPDPGDQAAA